MVWFGNVDYNRDPSPGLQGVDTLLDQGFVRPQDFQANGYERLYKPTAKCCVLFLRLFDVSPYRRKLAFEAVNLRLLLGG